MSVRGQCDSMMSDILGQSLLCQNSVAEQPNLLTSMAVIKVRTLNDGKVGIDNRVLQRFGEWGAKALVGNLRYLNFSWY